VRETRFFRLAHAGARKLAAQFCMEAPDFWTVTFSEPVKTREQEEKYHAQIRDIARQCEFMGQRWSEEEWKRLLIDAFARVKAEEGEPLKGWGRVVPSLDGAGVVQLGVQSRGFTKPIASEFVEHLYAYGAENGVKWTEKAER
jgi:hypothetical protein